MGWSSDDQAGRSDHMGKMAQARCGGGSVAIELHWRSLVLSKLRLSLVEGPRVGAGFLKRVYLPNSSYSWATPSQGSVKTRRHLCGLV